MTTFPARAIINHDAIAANITRLRQAADGAVMMAVVKSDAYGHGIMPVARTVLGAGASWLGVAQLNEALHLRNSGISAPILSWIFPPGERLDAALHADIDLSAAAPWALDEQAAAARRTGRQAAVHLKIDTGMGRGGATPNAWEELVVAAARLQRDGLITVRGVWSHLACADAPDPEATRQQLNEFHRALVVAQRAGIDPELRHLAASGGTLFHPDTHFDMVRPGIAVYGISPRATTPGAELGLQPAMRLEADLIHVKDVGAGTPVSYGHTYRTTTPTRLGIIPLGYGDGIPRHASNRAQLRVGERTVPVAGRICMDQFTCDLGPGDIAAGDTAVLFGDGAHGEPTAEEWARAADTIGYEIVTRIGPRVPRIHIGKGTR